ncbi:AsmA-like C-terminal domain-containing protein [Arcobacter sp. FWKO B]|uniref:YhdP family protein n=1 Tax=Arcobacter sp. FWKO B TaxID=2593672 RepID=UPI001907E9DB|nr:AsmA-like C-terminal domain-containing protein [Arcobacter sp. FWKO B]
MKKVIGIIFLIFFMVTAFYVQLKYFGVSISKIRFDSYYVEDFYIKLEQKLILTAKKIEISTFTDKKSSVKDVQDGINYIFDILKYFQKIQIDSMLLNDEHFSIAFNDDIFYFDNRIINISAKPQIDKNIVELDLHSLYLKEYDFLTVGKLKIDLNKESMSYFGNFIYDYAIGDLIFSANQDYLDFFVDTKKMENIKFVKNFVSLNETIEHWMYDSVFGEYQLGYIKGRIDLQQLQLVTNSLEGNATVENAKIRFQESLDFVDTKKVEVTYKNDTLSFALDNPFYKGISIDGSHVKITDMLGDNPVLTVDLKTDYVLDKKILEILKSYDIDIPILQKSGNTKANVIIKVDLKTIDVTTIGEFDIKDSIVSIQGVDLFAKYAKVMLQDYLVVVKELDAKYEDILEALVDITIDTKAQTIQGDGMIKSFVLKKGNNELISIQNYPSKFLYDIKNDSLNIFDLSFYLKKQANYYDIVINDLTKIKPYIKAYDISNIHKGNLSLKYFDENNIDFISDVRLNSSILLKNQEEVKNFSFKGTLKNNIFSMENSDKSVLFTLKDDIAELNLKEYDITYDTKDNEDDTSSFKLKVVANKSNIILNNKRTILSDKFTLTKDKNKIYFESSYLASNLKLSKLNGKLDISGVNLNDTFVNTFLLKKVIEGGLVGINLTTSESNKDVLVGDITLNDTLLENIAFINNLLTFVETSPAIINPLLAIPSAYRALTDGLGHDGYMVKTGTAKIAYNIEDEVMSFYEIYTKGSRADFVGDLQLNVKDRLIDGNINVIILKDYTNIVKNIPLVGYILLGDDKSVAISTKISGDLDDPQVETFATKDVIQGTGNIIKRIFTSPLKIFE